MEELNKTGGGGSMGGSVKLQRRRRGLGEVAARRAGTSVSREPGTASQSSRLAGRSFHS